MAQSNGVFISAEIASIAASDTIYPPGDYIAYDVPMSDILTSLAVQVTVTGGNASASGDVDFNLIGSVDGVVWDTITALTVTITMAGTATIVKSDQLDVGGYKYLRLGSIQNKDGSYTATLVHARWGKSFP